MRCLYLFCAGTLLLCLSGTARADDSHPESETLTSPKLRAYPEILVDDVKHVLTAPTRWQEQEWRNLEFAAIGVAGIAIILDSPIRDEMRRHAPNDNRFMLNVERFGAEYSLGVLGSFYLAGALGNNGTAIAVAQDGLAASLIASGVITPAIKFITGRGRPREDVGIANFRPFDGSYSLNSSFPSGHTTQAFAVAAVIANHYDEVWVVSASYSVAGLVGVARSYHDAHFASDILAGALIGTLVGKSVVAYNKPQRLRTVVLWPEINPEWTGIHLTSSF